MKRYLAIIFAAALSFCLFAGCGGAGNSELGQTSSSLDSGALMSDEEILDAVAPYLEELVLQDPSASGSMNDFLKANLNLDDTNVASAVLYLGAPNQNTGCFLMLTPTEDADLEEINEKLEQKGQSMVKTAEQGYTQGYAEYSIVESQGRIFLLMQPDAEKYNELVQIISEL